MAANPMRGETVLKVETATYRLVFDVNAFCTVQALLGMRPTEIVDKLADTPDDLVVPRALLWGAMQRNHDDVTLWGAGDIIGKMGMVAIREKLSEGLGLMFGVQQSEDRELPNPRKTKATKIRGTG